jgi:superfamily II DNA/RNA helicase
MPQQQKKAILQQWRSASSTAGSGPRFLVIFDVQVKPPEIPWSPLVINFDLPRSVEGYAHRAAAAVPPSKGGHGHMHGVVVSFVQAAGGDVEMLRSTECAYRFKVGPTVGRAVSERTHWRQQLISSRRKFLQSSMIYSIISSNLDVWKEEVSFWALVYILGRAFSSG